MAHTGRSDTTATLSRELSQALPAPALDHEQGESRTSLQYRPKSPREPSDLLVRDVASEMEKDSRAMTAIELHRTPYLLRQLGQRFCAILDGIGEARAMAEAFKVLSRMSDAELAQCGIKREEIAQTVLTQRRRR